MTRDHGDELGGPAEAAEKARADRELRIAERVAWSILALLGCAFAILVPIAFFKHP